MKITTTLTFPHQNLATQAGIPSYILELILSTSLSSASWNNATTQKAWMKCYDAGLEVTACSPPGLVNIHPPTSQQWGGLL